MYINFDTVEVLKSVGICYFSHNSNDLINLRDTEWSSLRAAWLPFENSQGADVRCEIVNLGKRLGGDINRLRIAVYEVDRPFESLVLFQMHHVSEALETMRSMADYGELVCCE